MWKAIPGWEGWYEISENGEVRSVARTVEFSDGRKRFYKGKNRSIHKDQFGYLKVCLKRNGKDFRAHIHILVALTFHGERPEGYVVRHLDGDHEHNHYTNLCYGTYKENIEDSRRHGTMVKGIRTHNAILTEELVRKIRASRGTISELADHFGVSRTTLWNVQNRKRWGWLP